MKIDTKFEYGDKVLIIHNDLVKQAEVVGIEFFNSTIYYRCRVYKAQTLMDKDTVEQKEEKNVFKNLDELKTRFKDEENR